MGRHPCHRHGLLKPWNEAFVNFVNGDEVHWPTASVKDMMRLRSDGKTDVWLDDRWEEGVDVWDLVNGDEDPSVLGWIRSKL